MLREFALPTVTILLLAGCSRQNVSAVAPPARDVVVTRPIEMAANPAATPGAPPYPATGADSPDQAASAPGRRVMLAQARSQPRNPVVSAEPADPPGQGKPSALRPPQRVAVEREPREQTVVIPAGTRIRVRLAQTLDTKRHPPGTPFEATLDDPIVVGRAVVVPRGTPFEGAVVESKSSGRFRGRAMLLVTLRTFRLHGTTYRISTANDARVSGNHNKRNLAFMGGGPAAGAGIGAIAGGGLGALIGAGAGAAAGATTAFITGRKDVKLPVETPLVFSLRTGVPLKQRG